MVAIKERTGNPKTSLESGMDEGETDGERETLDRDICRIGTKGPLEEKVGALE